MLTEHCIVQYNKNNKIGYIYLRYWITKNNWKNKNCLSRSYVNMKKSIRKVHFLKGSCSPSNHPEKPLYFYFIIILDNNSCFTITFECPLFKSLTHFMWMNSNFCFLFLQAMEEIPKIEVIDVYNSQTHFLTHKEVLEFFRWKMLPALSIWCN